MRILESQEVEELFSVFGTAVSEATLSPCAKSRRGAVVFKDGQILGKGNNSPKDDKFCIPPICYPICSEYCDHAEANALKDAISKGRDVEGASMFHIKVKGRAPVVSDDLSCLKCSTLVCEANIGEFILYQSSGFVAYPTEEFDKLTRKYLEEHPK